MIHSSKVKLASVDLLLIKIYWSYDTVQSQYSQYTVTNFDNHTLVLLSKAVYLTWSFCRYVVIYYKHIYEEADTPVTVYIHSSYTCSLYVLVI